jgi:hypothetical protein|nr:MAG TPA: hypothetical protein [Caudoviricetes sp.]
MNTSLFVGLCEDAGIEVKFLRELIYIHAFNGTLVATVDEAARARFWIDTYKVGEDCAAKVTEIVVPYALTPIEERE